MTLWVDFNRVDAGGRVPAVLQASPVWTIQEGDIVLAEDDEGTRCKAYIEEIRRAVTEAKAVAYLTLIPGSAEPSEKADWLEDTTTTYIESEQTDRESSHLENA